MREKSEINIRRKMSEKSEINKNTIVIEWLIRWEIGYKWEWNDEDCSK